MLSSLLPGLRDFRTPFACGALWALAIGLLADNGLPDVGDLASLLRASVPDEVEVPLIVALAYVLGVVAMGIQTVLIAQLRRTWRRASLWIPDPWAMRLPEADRGASGFGMDVDSQLELVLIERLKHVSGWLPSVVPVQFISEEFELAALRLSDDHPTQYGQFDRLRAEGEFRTAIAAPLVLVCIILAALSSGIIGTSVAVAGIVSGIWLVRDGARQTEGAYAVLASAIYFGFTTTPMLQSLIDESDSWNLDLRKEDDDRAQAMAIAAFLTFAAERNVLLEFAKGVAMARHPSRTANIWPLVVEALPRHVHQEIERELGPEPIA